MSETAETETETETEISTASVVLQDRQDRVGRKRVDPEALTQVIALAQLHSQHAPRIDPTSLGNLARRAGVPDWNVRAALRLQAQKASENPQAPRVLLGDALVTQGALAPKVRNTLIRRQHAMRSGHPSYQDTLELIDLAIAKTLALAGICESADLKL